MSSLFQGMIKSAAQLCVAAAAFSGMAQAATVAEVKQQIVDVAQANQTNRFNLTDVRAALDPLVAQLLALAPQQPEAQVAAKVAGGWRYLWADQEFPPFLNFKQIYQVVSPNGYYYNISRQDTPFGFALTGLLRGKYADAGNTLNIEFTRNALSYGWLANGSNLLDVAAKVESGEIQTLDVPGPIGVTGTLTNAYVDDNLRVIKGTGGFQGDTLFIMTRANEIAE